MKFGSFFSLTQIRIFSGPPKPYYSGAKSNNEVTRLQLENLNITEANFDIFFLHGPIIEDDGGEGLQVCVTT